MEPLLSTAYLPVKHHWTTTAARLGGSRRRALRVLLPLSALLGVLVLPWAPAVESRRPAREEAPAPSPDAQDARQTLEARRALSEDPRLARLQLGVRVYRGTATVWGRVPSAELVKQAVDRLRQVPGVENVQAELQVAAADEWPLEVPARLPPGRPAPEELDPAGPMPPAPGILAGREDETADQSQPSPARARVELGHPVPAPSKGPAPASRAPAREAVTIRPPLPVVSDTSSAKPERPAVLLSPQPAKRALDLSAALERLKQQEPRFRRIRSEVRERVVYLYGNSPDVAALAQAVARLPGVEGVVLRSGD